MRWFLPLLLLVGACQDRRSFDERYRDTATDIDGRANAIDANLSGAEAPATDR